MSATAAAERPLGAARVVLITGFDPWAVGNGSSLRVGRWRDALEASCGALETVVVPTAGTEPVLDTLRAPLPTRRAMRKGNRVLTADRWQDWMRRAAPLPGAAERAPVWMGRRLLKLLPWRPDLVVSFKVSLAPLAADLARECGVPLLVDLDDDEARLAVDSGAPDADAAANERLLRGVAELAVVLTLASPADVEGVATRLRADVAPVPQVRLVPNTVAMPSGPGHGPGEPGRALYVANFAYAPHQFSARWLLRDVVPQVRGLTHLDVVGFRSDGLECIPPAVARGRVPDLTPYYAAAPVVLCPVLSGSGTSIKVLEALAHGRGAVTTTVGARGLGLLDGEHLLIRDEADGFAAAVSDLLAHPEDAAAMGARGRDLVGAAYSDAVGSAAMVAAASAALALAPR